jgi:hypothetical protein
MPFAEMTGIPTPIPDRSMQAKAVAAFRVDTPVAACYFRFFQ